LLGGLKSKFPDAQIIADYTGGTKSMSAGLFAASLDVEGITIGLVSGDRFNLIKVKDGTQSLRTSHATQIHVERQIKSIPNSFKNFDYPTAMSWLEETLSLPDIPLAKQAMLQKWLVLARGLDSWDKFDHASAWKFLRNYRATYTNLVMFLEAVTWSRKKLDANFVREELPGLSKSPKGHGYELVEDLFLNAQRRATQHRFDDAVARLYRALELLAQARLKLQYGIDTGDVSLENLPQQLRGQYESMANPGGKIKLPLTSAFELLANLTAFYPEPLGEVYQQYKNQVKDFLSIRNKSLLAHGLTPVRAEDYKKAELFFTASVDEAFSKLALKPYAARKQFPLHPGGSS
jgi:CRISPR-associated protein (TIGR02710 family)